LLKTSILAILVSASSTPSRLNLCIRALELDARLGGGEPPSDALLLGIALGCPGVGFLAQGLNGRDAAIKALWG
jgi:hypothetical protein